MSQYGWGQLELDAPTPAPAALPSVLGPVRLFGATREHGGAVVLGKLSEEAIEDLTERGARRARPGALPRGIGNQAMLDAWVELLGPHFDASSSVNLTGTYSDSYGESNGLMLVRNVSRDFLRALAHERPDVWLPWCIGIEQHNTHRNVLHFHAMVGGDWSDEQIASLKAYWDFSRGWSVAKRVSDSGGCVAYCAKHLLKRGSEDNFDFSVTRPARAGSRQARRDAAA